MQADLDDCTSPGNDTYIAHFHTVGQCKGPEPAQGIKTLSFRYISVAIVVNASNSVLSSSLPPLKVQAQTQSV